MLRSSAQRLMCIVPTVMITPPLVEVYLARAPAGWPSSDYCNDDGNGNIEASELIGEGAVDDWNVVGNNVVDIVDG